MTDDTSRASLRKSLSPSSLSRTYITNGSSRTMGSGKNPAHMTYTDAEATSIKENQKKEKITSERFQANMLSLRKPRNPINGELTPRVNRHTTELCVPHPPSIKDKTEHCMTFRESEKALLSKEELDIAKQGVAKTICIRKQKINQELEKLSEIIALKRDSADFFKSVTSSITKK